MKIIRQVEKAKYTGNFHLLFRSSIKPATVPIKRCRAAKGIRRYIAANDSNPERGILRQPAKKARSTRIMKPSTMCMSVSGVR